MFDLKNKKDKSGYKKVDSLAGGQGYRVKSIHSNKFHCSMNSLQCKCKEILKTASNFISKD